MKYMRRTAIAVALTASLALAQHEHMRMDQETSSTNAGNDPEELQQSTPAMSGMAGTSGDVEGMHHHEEMGPHMAMSALRPARPEDRRRAQQIVDEARTALEPYKDWHKAEADGFKIFAPNIKDQPMFHFTNWRYAIEAAFRFDPAHPTSLLYKKVGENDYKLVGAMYTAPQRFNEEQLDERIPLSVARWHKHVNLCVPPKGRQKEMMGPGPRFGLGGSIATKEACEQAGGTFKPVIFGWMMHMYPYEKDAAGTWSLEAQKQNMHGQMETH